MRWAAVGAASCFSDRLYFGARRGRGRGNEIWRVQVVFTRNAHEREQSISTSVGEGRSHQPPREQLKGSTVDSCATLRLFLAEDSVQSAAPLPKRPANLSSASAFVPLRAEFLLSPLGCQLSARKIEAPLQRVQLFPSPVLEDPLS
jgi:hypothetical protein